MKISCIFCLLLTFTLVGCNSKPYEPNKWTQPIEIPKADIIFSTIIKGDSNDMFGKTKLVFFSFQDQQVFFLELPPDFALVEPYYLDPHTIIAMRKWGDYGVNDIGRPIPFVFTNDQYIDCDNLDGIMFSLNGEIIHSGSEGIGKITSVNCSIIETILSDNDLNDLGVDLYVSPGGLSYDQSYFFTEIDSSLVRIKISDKSIFYFNKIGLAPSPSPNNSKIVYLAIDGIRIMDFDGSSDYLAVPYPSSSTGSKSTFFFNGIAPDPKWSPDSTKIVYHKCPQSINESCSEINDYSIFVYDLESDTEELIFEGGLTPSWNYYK